MGLQTPFGEMEAIDAHTHIFPDTLFDHISGNILKPIIGQSIINGTPRDSCLLI